MLTIGVDIGGTSIKGGYVTEEGNVLDKFSLPIVKGQTGEEIINALADLINEFIAESDIDKKNIKGIGIGCPGAIDSENGVVDYSNNLGWENLPLVEIIKTKTGLPVKVSNDANVATLGEATFGAGKLYKNIIMLTLGTGVGGGIVINNKLYEGNQSKGAELGHATVVIDGELCTCGRRGCLEAYASATALMKHGRLVANKHPESLMWKMANGEESKIDGKVIFDSCKENDQAAVEVVDWYVKYLGEGILNYCNIFRPDAVILSGGVAKQGLYLTNKLTKYCADRNYGYSRTPEVKILTGVLGYDSGLIGAACLIIND